MTQHQWSQVPLTTFYVIVHNIGLVLPVDVDDFDQPKNWYSCLHLTLAASSQGPRRNSLLVARTLSRSSNTSRNVVACILLRPISLLSVWWLPNQATDWPGYADPPRHLSCRLPRRCSTNTEPDLPEPLQIMNKIEIHLYLTSHIDEIVQVWRLAFKVGRSSQEKFPGGEHRG